jgi:hypothetical protein
VKEEIFYSDESGGNKMVRESDLQIHRWQAFHLYYHEDRELLTREVVDPLVTSLGEAGWVDRFFFLYFSLGGPHVRLRLRVLPGYEAAVEKAVCAAARELFDRRPSTRSVPQEKILRVSQQIVANDPSETDDTVYPDNFVQVTGFQPETERYGGSTRLSASLDFFTASSLEALRFHRAGAERPRARRLTAALRTLLGQCWGHSESADRLVDLASYAQREWGPWMDPILNRGDKVFEGHEDQFVALASSGLEGLERGADATAPGGEGWLAEATRRFGLSLGVVDRALADGIQGSHVHMTGNRLGLANAEEVYLSRLLTRALEGVEERDPELWSRLGCGFRRWEASTSISLGEWVEPFVTGRTEAEGRGGLPEPREGTGF